MEFKNITKKLIKVLIEKGIKICVAESITGGKFAYEIIQNKNASKIFDFGLVTYSKNSKSKILKLENLLKNYNLVSQEISEGMIRGIIKYSNSKKILAISCTGQAGPGILNKKEKNGTVFISIGYKKKIYTFKKVFLLQKRIDIINATVNEMINLSFQIIKN